MKEGNNDRYAAFRVEWKTRRPRIMLGHLSFHQALTEISRTLIGRVDAGAVARVCEERVREKASAFAAIDEDVEALVNQLPGRGVSRGRARELELQARGEPASDTRVSWGEHQARIPDDRDSVSTGGASR